MSTAMSDSAMVEEPFKLGVSLALSRDLKATVRCYGTSGDGVFAVVDLAGYPARMTLIAHSVEALDRLAEVVAEAQTQLIGYETAWSSQDGLSPSSSPRECAGRM